MTIYNLSRKWFNFAFENISKVKPQHTSLYMFAIEHCNRLGWRKQFGFPTSLGMEYSGIATYKTYKKTLNDLVVFGFIEVVEKSSNQYSSKIISLIGIENENEKKNFSSLDKAIMNANNNDFALVVFTKALTKALTKAKPEALPIALTKTLTKALTEPLPKALTKALTKALPKARRMQDECKSSVYKPTILTNQQNKKDQQNKLTFKGDILKVVDTFLEETTPKKRKDFFNFLFKNSKFQFFLELKISEKSTKKILKKEKEKSSVIKEKEIQANDIANSKNEFLKILPTYFWQDEDDVFLKQLLVKLNHLMKQSGTKMTLTDTFYYYITNLPMYWRNKKMTMGNLSKNYNEIINEIKQNYDEKGKHKSDKNNTTRELEEFARNFGK